MRRVLKLIVALMLMSGGITAAPARAGEIATGAKIPSAFKEVDATSHVRNWSSIAGKKGTVLVLFRSAKWCPYCQAQLKSLKDVEYRSHIDAVDAGLDREPGAHRRNHCRHGR